MTTDDDEAQQPAADRAAAGLAEPGPAPDLVERAADGTTRAVVLVLHGGKSDSHERSRPTHLSALRMVPYSRMLHAWGRSRGLAVCTVRYRYRGWNGREMSPVQDARWALDEVRRRHGDVPVVLLGHSMGGRTAVHVADDPSVVAVLALAPWLPAGETVEAVRDRTVLVVHGTADRWTSPAESLAWSRRARSVATAVRRVEIQGVGHFMLRRVRLWNALASAFVQDALADRTDPGSAAKTDQISDHLRLGL